MQNQNGRDLPSALSVEDILTETRDRRRRSGGETGGAGRNWSMDEIDALLAPRETVTVGDIVTPELEEAAGMRGRDAIEKDAPGGSPSPEPKASIPPEEASGAQATQAFLPEERERQQTRGQYTGVLARPDAPDPDTVQQGSDGEDLTKSQLFRAFRDAPIRGGDSPRFADTAPFTPVGGRSGALGRNIRPRPPEQVERVDAGASMETDAYRARFIRRPVQELEKTAEHERLIAGRRAETIEKPGIIKRKSSFSATADLEPLPTIVPAEEELEEEKTIVARSDAATASLQESVEMMEGQIRLSGFEEPVLEQIDEYTAEQQLRVARKERVKQFRLFEGFRDLPGEEEDEEDEAGPLDEAADEDALEEAEPPHGRRSHAPDTARAEKAPSRDYTDSADAPRVLAGLKKKRIGMTVSAAVTGMLSAALLYFDLAPQLRAGFLPTGDVKTYLAAHLLLLVLAAAAGFSTIAQGLREIFRGRVNADTGVAAAILLCLIQTGVLFFYSNAAGDAVFLFGGIAAFCLCCNLCGKIAIFSRMEKNFAFCSGPDATHSIASIEKEDDAFEIGRGLLMGEPDIKYSVRSFFPARFLELSYKSDPADRLARKLTPVALLACVLIAVAAGVVTKSVPIGFSTLAGCSCIAVPFMALLASNLPLLCTASRLTPEGAAVTGHAAVRDCARANAVVFDSSDIFAQGGCNIHGIKMYHSMRIDEAILDTAAVVIGAGGPCGEIFDRVIEGRRELLPPVESLAYEDKLGLSGWIHGRRVLVGSRELLIHHSVEAPVKENEAKYRHDGRQVMYLAVAGKLSAMFVVSYQANEDIASQFRKLEECGVTILVRTSDSNITEELVEEYFGLPNHTVKIISAVAGRIYKKYRDTPRERADAYILHDGGVKSLLRAVSAAVVLNGKIRLLSVLQIIAVALGLGIVGILACASGLAQIGALQLLIYDLFWAAVVLILSLRQRV